MSEWISVKDKLPENDGTYLGYPYNGHYIFTYIKSANRWEPLHNRMPGIGGSITHWQRFPAPPKN